MKEENKINKYLAPVDLAQYVESLKLQVSIGGIKNQAIVSAIKDMPSPKKIRNDFSVEEAKALYETVGWAWKEICGQDILEQRNILATPEKLNGNYWFINHGIVFGGPNHFTIIRKNIDIFATMLKIDPFTIHEKLAQEPNQIISTVINHGGIRVFINKKEKSYFQMTSDTYKEWGKSKVYALDLKEKTVRLIDPKSSYIGWASGIPIKPY
jgi:hypothetical protein